MRSRSARVLYGLSRWSCKAQQQLWRSEKNTELILYFISHVTLGLKCFFKTGHTAIAISDTQKSLMFYIKRKE